VPTEASQAYDEGSIPFTRSNPLTRIQSDRCGDVGQSVALKAGEEVAFDVGDERRAIVGEGGVELHERRASADFCVGVCT